MNDSQHRYRSLVFRSVLTALLAGSAVHAQGDVLAYVDAGGDLWMIGDDQDTGIRVQAGGDDTDTFRVSGLAGTTINGVPEVTFVATGTRMVLLLGGGTNHAGMGTDYGGSPSCCQRDLVVIGGSGADELVMHGAFRDVTADLGPGDDTVTVTEGAGGLHGSLLLHGGDDVVRGFLVGITGHLDLGDGADLVDVEGGIGGLLDTGLGDDHVLVRDGRSSIDLRTGHGADVVELRDLRSGWVLLDAGEGDDRVLLDGKPAATSALVDPANLYLGPGNDRLTVSEVPFGRAVFDGGAGLDSYRLLAPSVFPFPPDVRAFEVPKAATASDLDAPSAIAGRVVDERGTPVPGAVVLLPELARATTTDGEGEFGFEDVLAGSRSPLELVVGVTWRGRPRSAAALVEPVAFRDAAPGAFVLVLDARRRNVLAFGSGMQRLAVDANLQTLGYRPEEVSTLATLPSDLAPYGVVWHTGGALTAADRTRLVEFVRAGGGLHLSGGTSTVNPTLQPLVTALVRAGGITLDVTGTASGSLVFDPDVVGGVATTPNQLTDLDRYEVRRFLGGLAERNVLARFPASGHRYAAAFEPLDLAGGRGHLTLVMDGAWLVAGESLDVLENLQAFLARQPGVLPR